MRRRTILNIWFFIILSCFVLAACNVTSRSADSTLYPTTRAPTEGYGLYDRCDLHNRATNCASRLRRMARNGFSLVINYYQFSADEKGTSEYTEADILAYLDVASSIGIKVILAMKEELWWNDTDFRVSFPQLATTCKCVSKEGFIRYVVETFGSHPAVWGYYLGDETERELFTAWLPYAKLIGELDPTRPRLYVGWVPNSCCRPTLNDDFRLFEQGSDVVAVDYYPIGRSDPPPPTEYAGVAAKQVQDFAKTRGKTAGVVLQSYALSQYDPACSLKPTCERYPTYEQLLAMRNSALTAQPRFIFWYSYFDIVRSDNPTQYWKNLVRVIKSPNP
jgi:hypothetical protein